MNKENRNKAYRDRNKDRISAYLKAWEQEHKAWRREYNRRYYLAHRVELIRRAADRKTAIKSDGPRRKKKL